MPLKISHIVLAVLVHIFISSKLQNKKIKINLHNIIIFILSIVIVYPITIIQNNGIRILNMFLVMIIIIKYLLKLDYKDAVFVSFFSHTIMFVGEIISMIILVIILSIFSISQETILVSELSILLVYIISLILIKNKSILKLYNNIRKTLLRNKEIVIKIFLITIVGLILVVINYVYNYENILLQNKAAIFLVDLIILGIVIYTIANYIIKELENKNLRLQNEKLGINLLEYETMLDTQRIASHENKNQLLIIKNMVTKKSMEASNYIDSLVEDNYEDIEEIYTLIKRIPSGGIQGIVYQKLLQISHLKIPYKIDVRVRANFEIADHISINLIRDICKVLGVLLDNSIEAVTESKEGIYINIYVEDAKLYFEILNNYYSKNKTIDLTKSSKNKERGHGLKLINNLVAENSKLNFKTTITKETINQIVSVELT